MTGLKRKIQAIMIGETAPGPVLKLWLILLSALYAMVVRLRRTLYDHKIFRTRRLPCGVISIGNLTVGGTGKTPMTIYLAHLLKNSGYQPAVISRGYKGQAEKRGGVVSDGDNILLDADIAGDEPFLMAQRLEGIPILVGADRFKAGMQAVNMFAPDIILLDDAFQHCRLHRDLDIVLVDDKSLFGNRHVLPRGILREPVSTISRADGFVLTRCSDNSNSGFHTLAEMAPGKPIFAASHEPYVAGVYNGMDNAAADGGVLKTSSNYDFLKAANVFVFSGIARNDEFFATVAALTGAVRGSIGFSDHHSYTPADFRLISHRAQKCLAEYLVTTEKDYVKIAGKIKSPVDIVVVGIRIAFQRDETAFSNFIKDSVAHFLN